MKMEIDMKGNGKKTKKYTIILSQLDTKYVNYFIRNA